MTKNKIITLLILFETYYSLVEGFYNSNHLMKKHKLPGLPHHVIDMLASKEMRIHHNLWHEVRNRWETLDELTKDKIKELNWDTPHPARDKDGNFIINNLSGEDFLYMHRQMIEMVNDYLKVCNTPYGKSVIGWENIPGPEDRDYPVPPAYSLNDLAATKRLEELKSDDYYFKVMKPLNDKFKNYNE